MMRFGWLLLLAPLLGGCLQASIGSVAGGECKIFERPPYVVLGRASYDQNWIDSQIEGGVGGCHWRRPGARPAELDAGRKVVAPIKKRGLFKRIRERVHAIKPAWPSATAPVTPTPEPPPIVVETPAPPPAPRSAIDELLSPNDRVRRVFP